MSANLTVQDLFKLILFLLGIGAVTYLIIVLKNLNKIVVQVGDLAKANAKQIDSVVKELPGISNNINSITSNLNHTLEDITPAINSITKNINNLSGKIDNVTDKATDTIDIVSDSISEAAYSIQYNIKNVDNYFKILMEIIETVKSFLKKK